MKNPKIIIRLSIVIFGFFLFSSVHASTVNWDFSGSSGYTYDSATTEFSNEQIQLKGASSSSWYSTSWGYRKKITFNNSAQAENLTNFSVLIKLNSSLIDYSKTQDSGQDIRFTDSDGLTLLSYEIEKWDESGISSVWVKIPQIDASSSIDNIYMYYGNSSAVDAQSASSVWNSNFVNVQHMEETPVAQVQTLSGFGGTGEGIVTHGNYIYVSNASNLTISKIDLTSFTVESTLNLGTGITETMSTDGTYLYVGWNSSPAKISRIRLSDFTFVDTITLASGENIASGMHIVGTNLYVGLWVSPGKVAKIDLTTFTQTSTLTLASGENHAEEGDNDGTYLYIPCENSRHIVKIRLSDFTEVESLQLDADETEPQQVLVNGNYLYIVTRQGANTGTAGKLIRIPLNDFQRSAGSVITTVKESNGIIALGDYLYIGNYSRDLPAIAQINIASFTQTSYVGLGGIGHGEGIVAIDGYIYGMSNVTGNGASMVKKIKIATSFFGDMLDSTSNANHGQTNSSIDSPDQVGAKISKGINFDGSSEYITVADDSTLKFGTGDFTISLWVKRTGDYTNDATPPELLEKQSGTPFYQIGISPNSNLPMVSIKGTTLRSATGTTALSVSEFTHVVAVVDNGVSLKLYVNGVLEATTNFAGAEDTDSTGTLLIGKGDSGYFGGVIDEVRVSNIALSDAWVLASYKSEHNTLNTFNSLETFFDINNPTVVPTNTTRFNSLSGFTETSTKNSGEIKYKISKNEGTTWYWYNSGWVETSGGYGEANTASVINSNISSFTTDSGYFSWKAYLHSDGQEVVQLDNVALVYTPYSISSNGGGGGGGGASYSITPVVSIPTPSIITPTTITPVVIPVKEIKPTIKNIKPVIYKFGNTILKNGSKGEGVRELQRFLNNTLNLGLVVDGQLGPKTIIVVKKWQKVNGLVPDGLIGPKTKIKMNAIAKQ